MKLIDALIQADPSIRTMRMSEQYPLAQRLIRARMRSGKNQSDFALDLGIPVAHWLHLESCDLETPVEIYEDYVRRAETHTSK